MKIKINVELTGKEYKNLINFINENLGFFKKKHRNHFVIEGWKVLRYFYNAKKDKLFIERMDQELEDYIIRTVDKYNIFTWFNYINEKANKTYKQNKKNIKKE